MRYTIKTFYSFTSQPEDRLEELKTALQQAAIPRNVLGLIILGKEGFNSTLAALNEASMDDFTQELFKILNITEHSMIKKSFSDKRPFRRFEVKVRPEIVTFERENFVPKGHHRHLSPDDWNTYMAREDVVVIDTRNDYETRIGKFKKALDLELKEFTDFSEKIKSLDTDREKPHLIYCTGGIRCEKAIFEMEAQGFKNVYQLEGGILNYLEQHPNKEYDGECFVFDSRVAVNQELKPSEKFSLCPQCGDVSHIEITCVKCDAPSKLCPKCHDKSKEQKELQTCSRNCRHHYVLRPDRKGPRQKYFFDE
jgi:UPF0176 protein